MNPDLKKEFDEMKKDLIETTKKIPKVLFEPSFDLIFELLDSKEVLINVPKYNIANHKALLSTENEKLIIDIENIHSDMSETYDIEIIIGNNIYEVSNLFISMRGTTLTKNKHNEYFSGKLTFRGQIHELKSKSKSNDFLFNRFIIPSKKSQLDYYVKSYNFRDESVIHSWGRLPIKINHLTFTLYEKKYRDDYYFIIDSNDKMDSEKFSDICHSIMIGFGFLSANFIQEKAFYFQSNDAEFESLDSFTYLKLRPSINSNGTCNPIYSNPYGYTKDESIINTIGKSIEVFNENNFSILCEKIYFEQDYATLILLILEANISSLILRPAAYSVALEKITNIIVEENKGLKPIPDETIAKKFRKKLSETLKSFKVEIEKIGNEDSTIILQKNIDKINNPTNRDKLTKPFEIYGIELTKNELIAIDNRNNFLHGREIKSDNDDSAFLEIYQISLRLNKLINKLILKHIGYSGVIINHLKHNENSFDISIDEHLFERI